MFKLSDAVLAFGALVAVRALITFLGVVNSLFGFIPCA